MYPFNRFNRTIHDAIVVLAFSFAGILLLGCGGDEVIVSQTIELPQPVIHGIGPSAVSAGQDITVTGERFADPEFGRTTILVDGTYTTASGASVPAHLEVPATFENQGVVTWYFGPNIPFSEQHEIGSFRGQIVAINVGHDGTSKQSAPREVRIDVMPSIILRQFRPTGAACDVALSATTEEQKFLIEADAVGLTAATPSAPIRFAYVMLKENFQFRGYSANELGFDPENLFPPTGPISILDTVSSGTVSILGNGVPHQVTVTKGDYSNSIGSVLPGTFDSYFDLTDLYTAPVNNETGNYYNATISIVAVDSAGNRAQRIAKLRVWKSVAINYNGHQEVARTFDPVPVSGCIPGGDVGRDSTYEEVTSETRSRTFAVDFEGRTSFNLDLSLISGELFTEFGFDVTAQVSSAEQQSLRTEGFIVPGQAAVWYRQTAQLQKRAELIGHDACGNQQQLGEVVVTDWIWSSDLAKKNSPNCPPFPSSNLPMGQDFIGNSDF